MSLLEKTERNADVEKYRIGQPVEPEPKGSSMLLFLGWMAINTLATIGIVSSFPRALNHADNDKVFTNKAIFADPSLRLNQSTFAAFHFAVTGLTLYVASQPALGMFIPARARFVEMLPLGLAMCLNVILPNLSLAFSSIAFYQIVRVLLTPSVAIINSVFYGTSIPRNAVYAIIPICLGIALVSYYDTRPVKEPPHMKQSAATTSFAGVCFAFAGVFASSICTVWIGTYREKFKMNSMQLLFNQAPISAFLLLYVVPFTDQPPHWNKVPQDRWVMILLASLIIREYERNADKLESGIMASLINISQFFIVAEAGAVSSTVVGHMKTCSIMALGWATSGRKTNDKGVVGIVVAMCGIIAYSIITYQHKQAQQARF